MSMCRMNLVVIFTVVILSVNSISYATELNLEQIVITAARTPQVIEDLGTNVTVITSEDIKTLKADTLGNVLGKISGIEVSKEGTLGANQSLSIRGCTTQQVLVMIDGRAINSTSLGLAEISQVPLSNVQRIEIIRGAHSSLYGANAVGGVINIITKKAEKEIPLTDIYFSVGDFNTSILSLNFSQKKGDFDYFLSGGQDISNGWRDNSDYENKNFSVALGYKMPRFGKLGLTGTYFTDELGIPGVSNVSIDKWDGTLERASSSPNARQESEKQSLSLEYENKIEENSNARVKIYGNEDIQTYVNPDWAVNDLRKNLTRGLEAQYNKSIETDNVIHEFTVGGDLRRDGFRQEDRNQKTDKISKKTEAHSVYVQDIIGFDDLILTLGLRYDKHSAYLEQTNPHLGLVWYPLENVKTSLNVARAFRAPTFNDLYWPYSQETYWGITYISQGNDTLKPEKAYSYDMGVEHQYKDVLLSKLTIFQINTEDMVSWKQTTVNATTYKYQPENYLRGINRGVEVEFKHNISKNISQTVDYAYLHAEGKQEGQDKYQLLRFKPHHRANYKIKYTNDFGFGIMLIGEFVSKQWEQDGHSGIKLPSYTLLDIRITQKIAGAELFFGVDNITDKRYMDRTDGFGKPYPMPGRTFFGGITVKLMG